MFLLDTNIVSEFRRARPHGGVLAWMNATDAAALFVSAVTFGELQIGIERTRQNNPIRAHEIEIWIDYISKAYNVLPMSVEIFRAWARLTKEKTNSNYADGMIAATALYHNLTIVTRNVRDFIPFNIPLLNPFEFAA